MAAEVQAVQVEIPDVGACVTSIPGSIASSKVRTWVHAPAMSHANLATPSSLQDESGNGHSLQVGTGVGTFKTNLVNGLAGVEFDGVDDQYRIFWPSATERITYFLILKHLTLPATGGQAIVSGETGGTAKLLALR